jgi:copper resistance protein B
MRTDVVCLKGEIVRCLHILALCVSTLVHANGQEHTHGERLFGMVQNELFEYRGADVGGASFNWDTRGWVGGDVERLWFKTQGGTRLNGDFRNAEMQLRYSKLVTPFWEFAAGARFDALPNQFRSFGVVAMHGLSPYLYEIDADLFVSDGGALSARLEVEYPILLTQRLILQPAFELNLAAQEVPEAGVASGLSQAELGIRLRYEIAREFAPYVGVVWEHRNLASSQHLPGISSVESTSVVAGLRWWF